MAQQTAPAVEAPAVVLTVSNMHGAFDPDGYDVWCPIADQVAWANSGFCQFCGNTNHERLSQPAR